MCRGTLTDSSLEWVSRHGIRSLLLLSHSMSARKYIRRLKNLTDTNLPSLQHLPNAKLAIEMARSQATNR